MRKLIGRILLIVVTPVHGQPTYKNYKIEWDSIRNTNVVIDTLTNKRVEIDYPYSQYPRVHFFRHGFVYVRTGDMRALMDLNGKKLIGPSHFINFNVRDSLISAYICSSGSWIFLNYSGDTLSYGRTRQGNYCPTLDGSLSPAHTMTSDRKQVLWGYLDQKARWKIQPIFEAAQPFKEGYAEVKLNGKWKMINEKGRFVRRTKNKSR